MPRRKPANRLGDLRPGTTVEWTRWKVWKEWREMGKALVHVNATYSQNCRQRAARLTIPSGYPTWFDFDKAAREWEAGL